MKPKIDSLLDCIAETEADVAVLTETWLRDAEVDGLVLDLSEGSGLGLLTLNRAPNENGVSYGGVAVVWRKSFAAFARVNLKNPSLYEVLVVAGSVKGHRRKVVIIACYLPPGYCRQRGGEALIYIEDAVMEMKRKYADPYIVVAGDFNQWKIGEGLADFVDIKEVPVGMTRGNKAIDRLFTNASRSVVEAGTLEPLETEGDEEIRRSDHRIAFYKMLLDRQRTFTWEKYSYRHYSEKGAENFKHWVVMHDWFEVLCAGTADEKASAYQETVVKAVERFFPLRTVKKRSDDPPWLDKKTRDLLEQKKRFYMEEGGRTAAWKLEKKNVDEVVRKRKRGFLDIQKERLLGPDASRNFYRQVRSFGTTEKPKLFDVRDLMPEGQSDRDTAEQLAAYFNRISDEFAPLKPHEIPCTRQKELPVLHEYEVASRVRRFKKPRSTVPGDIFPKLVTQFADFLAIPLTDIYNKITESREWPRCWKKEFVTIIPKKSNPQTLADLRNISCTLLASKIYESYILDWAKQEVALRSNQYGGVKGLGTDHLLVGMWQQILENAEDYRAGTVVTSIDYSKAFNRMGYQECLTALARNGASTPIIELIAAFLTDRVMMVKVGTVLSEERKVNGGCPQGSILGVFLFNATIDDLEEGSKELEDTRRSLRRQPKPTPSTPTRSSHSVLDLVESPIVRQPKRIPRRLNYTNELDMTVPQEPNHWTEAKWKAAVALFLRFIDDGFCLSKVNFENSIGFEVNGQKYRVKHAIQAQNIFRHVVRGAESLGMVVNSQKTAMMCISGATDFVADAYILDEDLNRIGCSQKIKALGLRFSNRLDMEDHVQYIIKSMRSRYWTLRNLKNSGFNCEELVHVYKTMIRPVVEYGCVVYHSSLTDDQDERLERLQDHALKCIFGTEQSARRLRGLADLPTLRERREQIVLKFATKCSNDPAYDHWFPRRTGRQTRNKEVYLEEQARCERLRNSPLFYFRRVLNGKVGKKYGSRNRSYREDVIRT